MRRKVNSTLAQIVGNITQQKILLAFVVLALVGVSATPALRLPQLAYAHRIAVGTPPAATGSRYMQTVDSTSGGRCSQAGQAQGDRSTNAGSPPYPNYDPNNAKPYNGVVVLDFGAQVNRPASGGWGTLLIGAGFVRNAQIEECAKQYVLGYYYRTPATNRNPPRLTVLIGTNNSVTSDTVDPYQAGQQWGSLVNRVSDHFRDNWPDVYSYIKIASANDIETDTHSGDWHESSWTKSWTSGYSNTGQHVYYNYGTAAGCYPAPGTTNPPSSICDYDPNNPATVYWRQSDVWYVSRGAMFARALPEIYFGGSGTTPSDVNARQWQKISLYGYSLTNNTAQKVVFGGSFTQFSDCGYDCGPGATTPETGWTQLAEQLNNMDPAYHGYQNPPSSCTSPSSGCHRTDQLLGWSTDIRFLTP
ncbi:MAG TPA: hypothetical protein VGE45_19005 [Chloroflexia bacterium]|jgi:hypothetical protein